MRREEEIREAIYWEDDSQLLEDTTSYFAAKYSRTVGVIGTLKVMAIASAKLNIGLPRFNLISVGETAEFKTQTTERAIELFPKSYCIADIDDFTMHALLERNKQKSISKKCILINDGNSLFRSKSPRMRERLLSGLARLLSDGEWNYGDRFDPKTSIKAKCSSLMNITHETYNEKDKTPLGKFRAIQLAHR
jgi:hypothetical protein